MNERSAPSTLLQLRAAIYQRNPRILEGIRHTISELLSIARTYSTLQKYDVTLNALDAIARLVAEYLQLRNGDLVMPSSFSAMTGQTTLLFDFVLTEAMEGLTSLHKDAIGRGDIQLSRQILTALKYVGLQSIDTVTLFSPPQENPTTSFIQGYIFGSVQDGAIRGLDDVTMVGADSLATIGKELLRRQKYFTALSSIGDIEKLAFLAIAQRKSHVTGESVKGLAEMLQIAVSQPVIRNFTIDNALDALQRITVAELGFKADPQDFVGLRFSLGAFLEITQPTALSNLFGLAINNYAEAVRDGKSERASDCSVVVRELIDDLWSRLVAIGAAAAATESFALYYVDANIHEIAKAGLWLRNFLDKRKPVRSGENLAHEAWQQERFAKDLVTGLKWIVGATYWRIFEAFNQPIKTTLVWNFFSTLADVGIRAIDAAVPEVAESAIDELKSIAVECIDKPIAGRLRSAAKVAVFIARVGIIAHKMEQQRILDYCLVALREFNNSYLAKQMETQPNARSYDAALPSEMDDLRKESRRRPWLDEDDAAFFGRVTAQDIDAFMAILFP
jgi:hypothetical protein